jgi:hypothetical protein
MNCRHTLFKRGLLKVIYGHLFSPYWCIIKSSILSSAVYLCICSSYISIVNSTQNIPQMFIQCVVVSFTEQIHFQGYHLALNNNHSLTPIEHKPPFCRKLVCWYCRCTPGNESVPRSGLEPTIYHTIGEHTNHYITDLVAQ